MTMKESIIERDQKRRNRERLLAYRAKRSNLKFGMFSAAPRLFTAKNQTIMEMVR